MAWEGEAPAEPKLGRSLALPGRSLELPGWSPALLFGLGGSLTLPFRPGYQSSSKTSPW